MIKKTFIAIYCFLSLFLFTVPLIAQEPVDAINTTLDTWHKSSGEVKFGPFINSLAADAVILGADREERWDKNHSDKFSEQYFNPKYAWNYTYQNRHIHFNTDSTTAWFDETFKINTKFFRGTGVLSKVDNDWKISQYSLSMLTPYQEVKSAIGGKLGQMSIITCCW